MSSLKVYRNRTTVVTFDLGINITGDTITAEIRAETSPTSTLLATWTVAITSAADGTGTLTLDNSAATTTAHDGWMDMIRTTGGEPHTLFDQPLRVQFVDMPTAVA